jgi:hypothetical protein
MADEIGRSRQWRVKMQSRTFCFSNSRKLLGISILAVALLTTGAKPFGIFRHDKYETIEATARGTSTQMGQQAGVSLEIYEYSTPDDRQMLVQAFEKGQNQGLVNALSKMKAVGHCSITGTLGYDVSYIRMIPTATGRQIRFVTNRPIRFGEAYWDTNSSYFNLTGGVIDLNDQDKSKSTGSLYPLAQLAIDKEGQLQIELNQNPWTLVDVLDWPGTSGVN